MAKSKLPTWATTVTPLSKMVALLMFILIPIAAFFYGTYYQQQMDMQSPQQAIIPSIPLPTPSPEISQPVSEQAPQPPNGTVKCKTDADCPANYYCTQAGPIIQGQQMQSKCWKKGYTVPL